MEAQESLALDTTQFNTTWHCFPKTHPQRGLALQSKLKKAVQGERGMESRQAKSADINEATMIYSCGKCREELSRQRDSKSSQQIVCGLCSCSIGPLFADRQIDCQHQNLKLPEIPLANGIPHIVSLHELMYQHMKDHKHNWTLNGELLKAARKKKRKKAKCKFTIATIFALSPQQALFSFIQEFNELPSTLVFLQNPGRDGVSISSHHSADVDLENITDKSQRTYCAVPYPLQICKSTS